MQRYDGKMSIPRKEMIAFGLRFLALNDMFCGIRNEVLNAICKFCFRVFCGRGKVPFQSQNFNLMIQKFGFRMIFCRGSSSFDIKKGLTTS